MLLKNKFNKKKAEKLTKTIQEIKAQDVHDPFAIQRKRFHNKMKGVYFFWDVDEGAFDDKGAASAFDGGTAAIAGGLGLLVGIIGTAIIMRKKKEQ